MLFDKVIPEREKVRRSFSFWPGEKGTVNRIYRRLVDQWLASRYCITDYFFALSQQYRKDRLMRVAELAKVATVELGTHPSQSEGVYLMSDECLALLDGLETGTYALI
jgi:hypothetical protein